MARYINADEITYDRINGCYMARATDIDDIPTADVIPLDTLDNIRAEINDVAFDWQEIDGEHESFKVVDLNDVLNIIDKYNAESEGKE